MSQSLAAQQDPESDDLAGEEAQGPDEAAPEASAQARLVDAVDEIVDISRSLDAAGRLASQRSLPSGPNLQLPRGADDDLPVSPSDLLFARSAGPKSKSRFRSRLDPEIVPEPPLDTQRPLTPLILAVGFAALAAFGIAILPWPQFAAQPPIAATDRATAVVAEPEAPPPQSHLVVADQQVFANEPLPLGVSVDNAMTNETLRLAGLAAGSRLSAGERIGDSSWRLRLRELQGLYLYAPADFVGVMHTGIDLVATDDRVIDRRDVELGWLAKKTSPPQLGEQADLDKTSASAYQTISQEDAAMLMNRGQDFLKSGDIAAARILFLRLADAGIAGGALAAAASYDPGFLAQNHVLGVRGDVAKARALYQRASQLGSTDATRALAQLSPQ